VVPPLAAVFGRPVRDFSAHTIAYNKATLGKFT
jgi:hypothetical protein